MSKPNFKPWRFVGQGILIDDDENEIVLGNVYSDDQIGWLIAAAPEMYAALKALDDADTNTKRTAAWGLLNAALAKAEGR